MSKENKVEMFDIDSLNTSEASNKGTEIQLVHPTKQTPLPIFFKVLGKDSDVFRSHMKDKVNRRMRQENMAQKRGKSIDVMTAEETEQEAVELLALCTLGWRTETWENGNPAKVLGSEDAIVSKGEKLTFSELNAAKVYIEQLWIRRQIDEAIGDIENFMKD